MAVRNLTEKAQRDRDAFDRLGRGGDCCSCHISPPCSYCVHPGNPTNQDENEACWTSYSKDEALWYAICQMRRAARVFDLVPSALKAYDTSYRDIYGKGLDLCADECEKVIDPAELERMRKETFPNEVPEN